MWRAALAVLLGVAACTKTQAAPAPPSFQEYWRSGKAEISRYSLEQARYGEMHGGEAVLIFVTEDFLPDRQVKSESTPPAPNALPVLKLNLVKEFPTGIYRYALMTTVFTPLDLAAHPRTLKVATSAQEWCGMAYTQLNLRGEAYQLRSHSYFEKEADEERTLPAALLEDEVWTRLRLDPERLPQGKISAIPGTLASRLRHRPLRAEPANASLREGAAPDLRRYVLEYPESSRTLRIEFRRAFPHEIVGFEETYPDGFGPSAKLLTTRATRTHVLRTDYWRHNRNADLPMRRELGLTY